ncbi:MAG: hypothetical protein JSV88_06290 [Candidatus Aminicenantes bacterium]|nr:MAG: hypothetical protein JSV88_06290 [Candidatus Aminicenantes bacterium]
MDRRKIYLQFEVLIFFTGARDMGDDLRPGRFAPGLDVTEGRYKVFDKKIKVFMDIKGRTFSETFTCNDDKSKLL